MGDRFLVVLANPTSCGWFPGGFTSPMRRVPPGGAHKVALRRARLVLGWVTVRRLDM